MLKHTCPCCGWTIRLADERPDMLAACSNCTQAVQVPGIPSEAIPECRTDSMIDWGTEGNPRTWDGVPLLPLELCIPLRVGKPARSFAVIGLLTIGISLFFAIPIGLPFSLGERLLFHGVGGLFALTGLYFLSHGVHRLRRSSRAQLLPAAQLPPEALDLGIPFALHRNQSALPPVVLFFIGVFLIAGAIGCVILLLLGEIQDWRMLLVASCGIGLGAAAIHSAVSYRRLLLLIYRDGFVILRGQETGVLWRWEDITIIHLQKSSNVPVMFSYTLRHKNGETFTFDHRLEYVENQFGARVQQALCRLMLPQLIRRLHAGEPAGFGPLLVTGEGLHHAEGFVPWHEVANITLDGDQLSIRKWKGDQGVVWSIPYNAIPNLALFFALTQLLLREGVNEGNSVLSMLAGRGDGLEGTAIQIDSSTFQSPPHVVSESRAT